ncbi:PREDICTED: antigen KI-67 [Gekko japonicus]|uniref:Antigen KI-67 n=1 Tax=Gekko japonicus TaxID=146911 RepID=A0ABM1JKN8_GEKJA|nr:PREDICTED: antigen KI-67 [Gekko japonicus]
MSNFSLSGNSFYISSSADEMLYICHGAQCVEIFRGEEMMCSDLNSDLSSQVISPNAKMPLFGKVVVIKRNGTDGTHFPLTVNSCTFGRKKECDIRIQLPQVSKEHCKIEVNENKEAVLINLSTVNPTQLNGSNFQQPIYLKHGDVLTIIDRSFRFEYPPAPPARKKISTSRSEEKETLQVIPYEKLNWEGQTNNGSDEQRTQDTTRQKDESTCKIRRSGRKSMSPFSTLYNLMKHEVDTKLTEESFSIKLSIQQKAEYSPRKDKRSIAASQTPQRISVSGETIQIEETKTALENFKQPTGTENQGINMIVSRRSSRVLQIYAANERQDREKINLLHFQNVKENEDSEVIKSSNNDASSGCLSMSCSIVTLENIEKASCYEKSISLSTEIANVEVKTNLNTSGSVESVLPRSKAEGESLETCSSPSSRQASGMLQIESDPLLGLKSRNNELLDTEQPLDAQLLEETKTESDPLQDGHLETIACLVHRNDSKSPRRSSRQRRNFTNTGSVIMEESLLTTKDVSPFKGVAEENKVKYWPQKNGGYIEERPTTKNLENNFVMKNTAGSSCLSKRCHKSCVRMPSKDVQEMNMSNQCNMKEEPTIQKSPQKRKRGEFDLSVQPLGKRKRVSFGGHLSPELFDKHLPPNSPLKRGAIPARFSLPCGKSPQAVLKKASEFKPCVKGFSGKDQQENTLLRKGSPVASPTAQRSLAMFSCNSPHMRGRFSVSRVDVPSISSVEQNVPAKEIDVTKEIKTPETSHQDSQNAQSVRRSGKLVSKRTSLHRRSGAMDAIRAKRQSGASEANLIVSKSWAEVVKQGIPKSQRRTTPKCGLKRRPTKKMPTKALKSNVASLKTPTRKVKDYSTTGHANSPAPIVVGKAHTSIVKMIAQVPKVMFNYTLQQQQDMNESFTGMTEMFHTPLNWKQGSALSSVQKSSMSSPEEASEIHTPEESGEMTVSTSNLSIQQIYDNQDESPILRKVSQISTVGQHELKVPRGGSSALDKTVRENSSLVTGETVGMEEMIRDPKEKSDCIEAHSGTKRLVRTPKQEPMLTDALSGLKRLFRTPKQKPEPVDALSGVKRLLKTPKQKPEQAEALSGVKKLLRTPKQKSEPVDAPSGVKRLLKTPKQKPEQVEALSGVKGLFRTPKQDPESGKELSGVKRVLGTPKPEPVEALSGVKGLFRTPKQDPESGKELSGVKRVLGTPKPEPVEALSGTKRLLRTPKQDPELGEELSGVKRVLRTPKQDPELGEELSGVKRVLGTPKPEPVEALSGTKRLLRTPKQDPELGEELSGVKRVLRTPKQDPELGEELSGVKRVLGTPKPEPVEALSGTKRLLRTPKQDPELGEELSGVKRLLRTPNHKAEPVKDDICSKHLNSPEGLFGLNNVTKEQKEKIGLLEDMEGIQRLFRTPKQKFEPVEDMIGISRILKTPKQKFMPVDDYLGLQKLMAEPKQNSLSGEIDYTGVKELLGPVDGYLVKLSESVNKPHEISSNEFECKEDDPEREESWQETGLEDSFEKKSPNAMPRKPDDGHDELQDYLGHTSCSSVNDVKGARVESIATVQLVSEICKSDGLDFQSGAVIDLIEESSVRQGDPVEINAEIKELLASVKKPRKGKASEFSFVEERDTTKTPRQTRKSSRAKSVNCMQINENFDQNIPETSQPKESDSNPLALENETTERLREKSIETNGDMDFDNMKHTQKLLGLSKEMSDETQLSVSRRRVATKLNRRAEEGLHLEENATDQEYANQLISKTSLRSRNQKNKDEPKSEFTKTSPQGEMQSSNLETSKRNSGNQLLKKNTRRRKATSVETEMEDVDGEKHSSPKICKLKTLEHHPTEMKEGEIRRRKRGRVCFLLEKGTSETPEEKCVFDGEGGTQQEQYSAFSERNTSPVKENTSPKNKKEEAAPVVSLSFCTSFSSEILKNAAGESSFTEEHDTTKTPRQTRNSSRAKLTNCTQTNENFDQNIPETSQPKESDSNPLALENETTERLREKSIETNGDMDFDNMKHTQKLLGLSKEMSVETQLSVSRRKVVAKLNRRTEESLHLEENAADQEYANQLISKTSLRSRNQKNKDEPKSEFTKTSPQGEMQSSNLETSKRNSGNQLLKKNTRRRKAASVQTEMEAVDGEKHTSPKICKLETLETHPTEMKEDVIRRRKRGKVCFLLEKGTSETPEDKCVFGGKGGTQQEQYNAFSECTSPIEEDTSPLLNMQISVEHSSPKTQKVAVPKRNPPRRGRSRAASPKPPTENASKVTPKIEKQPMSVENAIFSNEKHSKRGRGRKVAPVSQTLETPTVPKEDPSTGSSVFAQGECLQGTQNENNFNEVQKVCLDNIQAIVEHIRPKRQKVTRGNLLQNDRSKQGVSHEPAMESDNKENPDVENQDVVVENAFTAKENQPKRGRRKKIASVTQTRKNLTVPKEDTSTGSFSFAQKKFLQDTQNEEKSDETQTVVLDNIESSVEHILPKRQKVARGNLRQRGRSKQVVSDEQSTEKDNKDTPDVVNQDMVVENAFTVKENQPKRGRGRKVAAVPQILESNNFPYKDKSGAEEQAEALEIATTANKNPSHRGRCRKTLITSSVPSSKEPRMVDNVNQEEMARVLKDVTKENVSKKGRRELPVYEAPTETNIPQRATGSKPIRVKGKKVSADSLFESQSKRSQGKNIVLAFQTPTSPALKISITLPSPSGKNETASENQNLFIENHVAGKENLAINGGRDKKIVPRSTSVRRKCKLPKEEDEGQENQNINIEKPGVSNDKRSRRAMRKGGAPEKGGLPEGTDGIPKDQQVIMANTISGMEDASQGRRNRILKGKNMPKHSDQKKDLEITTLPQGKENSSKRGRRKPVSTESETHSTISGMKKCLFAENMTSAPEAENTESTLQKGRRKKMKEEHMSVITESAAETQTKIIATRRTRKQVL